MFAISTPYRRAFSSAVALALCTACATYVDEPPVPGSLGLTGGGSGGDGGSDMAGSQGMQPVPSSGAGGGGAGVSGKGGAGESSLGGAAGGGGMGAGGVGGKAGAGGMGGAAGAGGAGGAGGKAAGGSGGGGAVQACSAHPIPAKSTWKLSASHSGPNDPVTNAHDGVTTNRWSTGKDQSGNEWLQLDFGVEVGLTKLTLQLDASVNDYPRMYQTRISNTAMNMAAPALASGSGTASQDTVMTLPKGTRGRYVLISQTGSVTALWWSVAEIQTECAD